MTTRVLTGVRASEMARCCRMAAIRGLGVEPAEPPESARRFLARGVWFGLYVYEQFVAKYGKQDVAREVWIPWGDGWVGHADIVIWRERLVIEVVSSVSPDGILPTKIKQVRQYLHFAQQSNDVYLKNLDRAAVYVVNPSTLDREELIPVLLSDDDREEIDRDVAMVRQAISGGFLSLPPCAAASPSECRRALMCPFTDFAWEGWEPPVAVDLSADTEATELAQRLYAVKRRRERRRDEDSEDDKEQRKIQAALLGRGLAPKIPHTFGGVQITYSPVAGRETFSLSNARKAGHGAVFDNEPLSAFCKLGEPSSRFTIKRLDGMDVDTDDYGEAPF